MSRCSSGSMIPAVRPPHECSAVYQSAALAFLQNARIERSLCSPAAAGQSLQLLLDADTLDVRIPLVGTHNALNALAAALLARQLQIPNDAIIQGLQQVSRVPGRMEAMDSGQLFSVFVDFAHTPDGLRQAVATLKPVTAGKLIVVFGAGGDRDRRKRPLMALAVQSADAVIVTSDNPRYEAPQQIIEEICSGFQHTAHVQRLCRPRNRHPHRTACRSPRRHRTHRRTRT